MIVFMPSTFGKPTMKSIETDTQGLSGIGSGCNKPDIAIWWQYPTTKQVVAPLMPQMVACFKASLSHQCSPCLPIKEACFYESK
jgi:hypothetical protein